MTMRLYQAGILLACTIALLDAGQDLLDEYVSLPWSICAMLSVSVASAAPLLALMHLWRQAQKFSAVSAIFGWSAYGLLSVSIAAWSHELYLGPSRASGAHHLHLVALPVVACLMAAALTALSIAVHFVHKRAVARET